MNICIFIHSIENGNETLDARDSFEPLTDLWNEVYYKRSFDNSDKWIYFATYDAQKSLDPNASAPFVTATKVLTTESKNYKPGGKFSLLNSTEILPCFKLSSVLLTFSAFVLCNISVNNRSKG